MRDVRDVLLYQQTRPFAEQRKRFLAHRTPSLPYPDLFQQLVKEQTGEQLDSKTLNEQQRWDYVQKFYETRHATMQGGFDIVGAALDGPRALCGAVWLQTQETTDIDWLSALMQKRDEFEYWRGGLIHCGLPITEPVPTADAVWKRDGKILRLELQIVLELRNGERAPMMIQAFYDPQTKHWGFDATCMTSTPFEAQVLSTR